MKVNILTFKLAHFSPIVFGVGGIFWVGGGWVDNFYGWLGWVEVYFRRVGIEAYFGWIGEGGHFLCVGGSG